MRKPTLFQSTEDEEKTLRLASLALHAMPRGGPILSVSMRVFPATGTDALVLHLDSGAEVSEERRHGESWSALIDRLNVRLASLPEEG